MTALARGQCPECGRDVALRRNGLVREHRVYLPQLEQDPRAFAAVQAYRQAGRS